MQSTKRSLSIQSNSEQGTSTRCVLMPPNQTTLISSFRDFSVKRPKQSCERCSQPLSQERQRMHFDCSKLSFKPKNYTSSEGNIKRRADGMYGCPNCNHATFRQHEWEVCQLNFGSWDGGSDDSFLGPCPELPIYG